MRDLCADALVVKAIPADVREGTPRAQDVAGDHACDQQLVVGGKVDRIAQLAVQPRQCGGNNRQA